MLLSDNITNIYIAWILDSLQSLMLPKATVPFDLQGLHKFAKLCMNDYWQMIWMAISVCMYVLDIHFCFRRWHYIDFFQSPGWQSQHGDTLTWAWIFMRKGVDSWLFNSRNVH